MIKVIATKILTLLTVFLLAASALLTTPKGVSAAATIVVTTTDDQFGAGSECSLREAIRAANTNAAFGGCPAGSGADQIYLAPGNYKLSIIGALEDGTATGDLDILDDVTILGAGKDQTSIYAQEGFGDRVIHVKSTDRTISVTISGVKISNGYVEANPGGGGILNDRSNLTLTYVSVIANTVHPRSVGGGLSNLSGSVLTIIASSFTNNSAGYGGGIYNGGKATIVNSLIYANSGQASGGGIDNAPLLPSEAAVLVNVTVAANTSISETGGGAGVSVSGKMTIINSTIYKNVGSGIYLNENANLMVANSIVARHTSQPNCVIADGASVTLTSNGYNLIDSFNPSNPSFTECNFAGPGDLINENPYLAENLVNTGGPTGFYPFINITTANKAIDGVPAGNPYCPSVDQRLYGRPGDGNKDGVALCDIGSFEEGGLINKLSLPMVRR